MAVDASAVLRVRVKIIGGARTLGPSTWIGSATPCLDLRDCQSLNGRHYIASMRFNWTLRVHEYRIKLMMRYVQYLLLRA